MNKYSHEALDSIEGLFTFCEHILDEPLEDQDLIAIQDKLTCLQRQCDAYQEQLRDQKVHSKSDQVNKRLTLISLLLMSFKKNGLSIDAPSGMSLSSSAI